MLVGTWYGMNFHDMPELGARHGYLVALAITLASTGATFLYFKRRGWL